MARRPEEFTVAIDQASAGTDELLAAAAGTVIKVLNYTVVMDGAGTFKFRTGNRDLSGAIPAEDRGGVCTVGDRDSAVLVGDEGANLNIVSTTGAAKGHLTCVRLPGG
jgi:hypothetical protein